jgi:ABC-type glutathione transport system ATPase component
MSGTDGVLEARDVWAAYGSTSVLQGVDLTVRPGDAVGLLGRSGIGKSTLLELLGGAARPDRGQVTFSGRPTHKPPRRDRKAFKARLRTVHQNGLVGIDALHTVERVLSSALGDARSAGRSTGRDVDEVLALLDLPIGYATRRVGTLSGGERQRLAIAHAVATRPDLVLLDEPLTAVDPGMRDDLADRLAELVGAEGIGLLVASHDVRLLDRLTRHVHVLADGRLVESGPLREVLADPEHEDTRALVAALPHAVRVASVGVG